MRNGLGDISQDFHWDRAESQIWAASVWKLPAREGQPAVQLLGTTAKGSVADRLFSLLESVSQSELKEGKTQKLDTVVFCY